METVFYCSNSELRFNDFNLYVMGKKYVLFLSSAILVLCNRVKVVKLQVILSCPEQNILILVDKMFRHISVRLSRLIGRLFISLLYINSTKTCTERIKSSDDEEFRKIKLKLA